jgi:hypothetical protein
MEKNILSEIDQMKYLFGYKAGKVLSEQTVPVSAQSIWKELKNSIEGMGTSLPKLKQACGKVTTKQIYDQLLALVKQEYPEYKFVMSYIMDDFNTMFDQPQYTLVHAGKGGYGADGFDTSEDTTTAKFCASTMSKFNSDEWSTGFMDGVNTPYG